MSLTEKKILEERLRCLKIEKATITRIAQPVIRRLKQLRTEIDRLEKEVTSE